MKKQRLFRALQPSGILRWSTACILAGGLISCDNSVREVATEEDVKMAETQSQIEALDTQKSQLQSGEVTQNFHLPRVGYYHPDAHDFFEHPHGFSKDGKFFIDGEWRDQWAAATLPSSRPSPEALKKVEAALEEEQKTAAAQPATQNHYHSGGGFGIGNALMMYWMLSGNRGSFLPGNGFRQASSQAGNWQNSVEKQRGAVNAHAAANPSYQRMVQQSRASGTPVKAGQSVRSGFGSRSSSFSSGS